MKYVIALATAFVVLTTTSADAYTCKEVRDFACSHTQEELATIKQFMTAKQLRDALRCLKHSRRCP